MSRPIQRRVALLAQLLFGMIVARHMDRERYSWRRLVGWTSRFASGFFSLLQIHEEIESLLIEVERLEPLNILEIGTAGGGTLFLLSRAATRDSVLISVDLPKGAWGGGYSWWRGSIYKQLLRPGQRCRLIRGDSHSASSLDGVKAALGGRSLDVLFIDGDHSYAGVRQDFNMYAPLVRRDGLIAFHDIVVHPPSTKTEVSQFWNELKGSYEHKEFIKDPAQGWAGIGVLFNNPRDGVDRST
ncbi:MAG: class I SAM-dependent methyltransferase [Candidatus Micrarchaeaceae archaeon]